MTFQIHPLADVDVSTLIERIQEVPDEVGRTAQAIVAQVATYGDSAVREITKRLDNVEIDAPFLDQAAWDAAAAEVAPEVAKAIDGNLARIQAFHEMQRAGAQELEVAPGVLLGRRPVPHDVVGCYVPGGRARYPSSVLMTVAPARIAGVERIIVATPPGRETLIDPAVAYAAKAAGATDILTVGGAQAVAALAFGTKRIPRAAAIVGPGNAYVTAAKRIVNAMVWTDAPAGPSELLVLADDTADARLIALDMVAQAEHDPEAQVVLVSTDADLPARVHEHVDTLLVDHPRQEIVETSLTDKGVALIVEDVDAAIGFADDYAAEHVEVHMADARLVADRLRHAGSIFIGPHAPVPVGDYGSGTNHVLPTMGFARTRGGLSVEDFRKWVTYQELSAEGLAGIADDVATLADAEGLAGHAQAIRDRLEGA